MEITFVDQPFNDNEYADGLKTLGQIGYKRVEVKDRRIRTFGLDNMEGILEEAGISVIQINTYFDVVNGPEVVKKSLELNREMTGYALRLKAPFIRVFTGPLGEGSVSTTQATEEIWEQAADGLRQLCAEGADHGLSYYVETHHNTLAETTPSILRLLEMVDAPNFGVNLQVPLKDEPDIYETTRLLAPHVRHTHLNNFDKEGHNTFLEEGTIDIRREIAILKEAGFNGALSVEHAYHHRPVVETAKKEFAFLSAIIDSFNPVIP